MSALRPIIPPDEDPFEGIGAPPPEPACLPVGFSRQTAEERRRSLQALWNELPPKTPPPLPPAIIESPKANPPEVKQIDPNVSFKGESSLAWRTIFAAKRPITRIEWVVIAAILIGGLLILGILWLVGVFLKNSVYDLLVNWLSVPFALGLFWYPCRVLLRAIRADSKPLRPFCPQCGKYVATELNWKCGFCDAEIDGEQCSFLWKCGFCDAAPKACRCPHCSVVISLAPHCDERHAAIFLTSVEVVAKPIAEARREELEKIGHDTTLARMKADLAVAESLCKTAEARSKNSASHDGSDVEKVFQSHWNRNLEIHKLAEQYRKRAEQDYGDNPQMLEKSKLAIQDCVVSLLTKMDKE